MRVKLKDITKFSKGTQINGKNLIDDGAYSYLNGGIKPSGKWNEFNVAENTVTISEGGNSSGYVNYMNEAFWCGAHCYYLYDGPKNSKYLYYALKSQQERLFRIRSGACMPNIKKSDLGNFIIEYEEDETRQEEVVKVLEKCELLIEDYNKKLVLLDEAVRARFVEMFGTIRENSHNYPRVTLKEVCHKITDGKHGGCKQEDNSGYYYVGAREIYDGKIHYDTAPQITYDDFSKDYRRCNLEKGDMVIVNTGATIGKSAIASSHLTEKTLLQKSVALIKVNSDIIIAEFLRYCYMVNPSMYMVKSASAQPNLLLSKMNSTIVYLPPIDLQRQFASFVEEIDKSRSRIQKSLEASQELFDSLMQEYFG